MDEICSVNIQVRSAKAEDILNAQNIPLCSVTIDLQNDSPYPHPYIETRLCTGEIRVDPTHYEEMIQYCENHNIIITDVTFSYGTGCISDYSHIKYMTTQSGQRKAESLAQTKRDKRLMELELQLKVLETPSFIISAEQEDEDKDKGRNFDMDCTEF